MNSRRWAVLAAESSEAGRAPTSFLTARTSSSPKPVVGEAGVLERAAGCGPARRPRARAPRAARRRARRPGSRPSRSPSSARSRWAPRLSSSATRSSSWLCASEGRGGPLLGLPGQRRGVLALAGEDLDLLGQGGGPLVGGPRGEGEPLVLPLQALQLGLEVPDAGVLGGLLLGLPLLRRARPPVAPSTDLRIRLLLGAQGRQQQALGGVGLRQAPRRSPGRGSPGPRRSPGGICSWTAVRKAPHAAASWHDPRATPRKRGCPAAGLAGQGVGLDAPRQQYLLEPRNALAELRQRPPGVQPAEAAHTPAPLAGPRAVRLLWWGLHRRPPSAPLASISSSLGLGSDTRTPSANSRCHTESS